MMLVGEAGKRAAHDGNFPKIYGETDKSGIARKGLILASVKMTLLMIAITLFSGSSNSGDLFSQLTTIAVLLTMLPYFYSSVNLIRLESRTSRNFFVLSFSGIACVFCLIALAGAEGSALTGTFLVSLIILVFYGKKLGISQAATGQESPVVTSEEEQKS